MTLEEMQAEKAYLVGSLEKAIRKEDWPELRDIADRLDYLEDDIATEREAESLEEAKRGGE